MISTGRVLYVALCVAGLLGGSAVHAQSIPCAQPVSMGDAPTASDCLYILQVAVGIATCPSMDCACDTDGSGTTSATDALGCLKRAVGDLSIDLICCGDTSTTSTTSLPDITTTTTTTSSTTTSTLPTDFDPMVRLTGGGCAETLSANGLVWTVPGDMAGEKSAYQDFPGDMIGPFTWSSDGCGENPVEDLVIPTVWRVGRAQDCRYALNALNGVSGVVSLLSEFGSPECRPELIAQ